MAEQLKTAPVLDFPPVLEPPEQPGEFELAARHFRDNGQWTELSERPREAVVSHYRWLAEAH